MLVVTTMAAIGGAAWHYFARISESDLLALLIIVVGPMLAPAALILAIYLFFPSPYHRTVREVDDQRDRDRAECDEE